MAEYYTNLTLSGLPIALSQQTRFKSASEVTQMRKRTVVNNYYGNYPQSQKAAYASTYTTFKAGAVYNDTGESTISLVPTCCTNGNSFVLANNKALVPGGEKQTANMFVSSRAVINNPQ
jgi:hypothetical protein